MTYEPNQGLDLKYSKLSRQVFKAILKSGYFRESFGDWSIFSKTFGWYRLSKTLTEEQKSDVETMWKSKSEEIFE